MAIRQWSQHVAWPTGGYMPVSASADFLWR